MGWTAPRTWTDGDTPSASQFNTDFRDNLNYLHGAIHTFLTGKVHSNGTIDAGTGFTITKGSTGIYTVNITSAFSANPVVVVSPYSSNPRSAAVNLPWSTTQFGVKIYNSSTGAAVDDDFMFIAMDML